MIDHIEQTQPIPVFDGHLASDKQIISDIEIDGVLSGLRNVIFIRCYVHHTALIAGLQGVIFRDCPFEAGAFVNGVQIIDLQDEVPGVTFDDCWITDLGPEGDEVPA